ncbi:MAG: L,D-transpeptidase [Proteobacteria bacterium]|nr:L,D-transpeptidase [Pseudomonadota bacterium]
MTKLIEVSIPLQQLTFYENNKAVKAYSISSGKNGVGEEWGSEKTPRGWHRIRAKIGAHAPLNTVFISRRPTGEIYSPEFAKGQPGRDWILTRILWLCGLEPGKNRHGSVDTMRRMVYIHGAPDEVSMGIPGSRGCIRMRNADIVELFEWVDTATKVYIDG